MLGEDLAANIDQLRAEAESLQVTPCVITREGALSTDPDTGAPIRNPVRVWPVSATTGSCQIVDSALQPREAGEDPQVSAGGIMIKLPAEAAAAGICIGDLVDAGGRRFTVRRTVAKTMMVVFRLVCDELPPTPVTDPS